MNRRHSALNPEATDEEWAAELTDQLQALALARPDVPEQETSRPRLVYSTETPDIPAPRPGDDERPTLRVAE